MKAYRVVTRLALVSVLAHFFSVQAVAETYDPELKKLAHQEVDDTRRLFESVPPRRQFGALTLLPAAVGIDPDVSYRRVRDHTLDQLREWQVWDRHVVDYLRDSATVRTKIALSHRKKEEFQIPASSYAAEILIFEVPARNQSEEDIFTLLDIMKDKLKYSSAYRMSLLGHLKSTTARQLSTTKFRFDRSKPDSAINKRILETLKFMEGNEDSTNNILAVRALLGLIERSAKGGRLEAHVGEISKGETHSELDSDGQ